MSPEPSNSPKQTSGEVEAAGLVAGVHIVVIETPKGTHRRRAFFSLHSAQVAADKSVMAGNPAHIILCKLTPVPGGEL